MHVRFSLALLANQTGPKNPVLLFLSVADRRKILPPVLGFQHTGDPVILASITYRHVHILLLRRRTWSYRYFRSTSADPCLSGEDPGDKRRRRQRPPRWEDRVCRKGENRDFIIIKSGLRPFAPQMGFTGQPLSNRAHTLERRLGAKFILFLFWQDVFLPLLHGKKFGTGGLQSAFCNIRVLNLGLTS